MPACPGTRVQEQEERSAASGRSRPRCRWQHVARRVANDAAIAEAHAASRSLSRARTSRAGSATIWRALSTVERRTSAKTASRPPAPGLSWPMLLGCRERVEGCQVIGRRLGIGPRRASDRDRVSTETGHPTQTGHPTETASDRDWASRPGRTAPGRRGRRASRVHAGRPRTAIASLGNENRPHLAVTRNATLTSSIPGPGVNPGQIVWGATRRRGRRHPHPST